MKRTFSMGMALLASMGLALPSMPAGADSEGWSYATLPIGAGATEVNTVVLRDAPEAFVTDFGWRFSTSSGWTQIATTGGGDPGFLATEDALYATWGAENGSSYDDARPAIRVDGPGSDAPITQIMQFDVSPCARLHEALFALDPVSGAMMFDGSAHGLPAPPANYQMDGCLENTTNPQSTLNAISYPYRVAGTQATAMAPRPNCVFGSPTPTSTPGLFAHGCINSMLDDAGYDVVFEQPDGTDRRIHLSDSQRTLFGGVRDLKLDDGNGAPNAEFIATFPRPHLAYGSASDTFIALVGQATPAGLAGEHWYDSTLVFVSRDGGETWTDEGNLCGSLGADCYAGGVVYDPVTDTFVINWMQRHAGYGRAHDIVVTRIGGALPTDGSGKLEREPQTIDTVSWDGFPPTTQHCLCDLHMVPGNYGGFVAFGYFKDGATRYAYRQF